MAYVISISNGKGGVAKTTSCIALGSSLAVMGYQVLLIDLDANANLTLGFGYFPEKPVGYSKDLFFAGSAQFVKGIKTGFKNLDIIPSNKELSSINEKTFFNSSTTLLKLAFRTPSLKSYDFILVDCPPALGFLTTNALTASDLLIIPTQPEFFSAYAIQSMFQEIGDIRQKANPYLKYRILITLLDQRLREHGNILNQLQKHLGDSLYKTTIQVDTHFRESQTLGIPITYSAPESRGALQYKILVQEIVDDITKQGHDLTKRQYGGSSLKKFDGYNPDTQRNQPSNQATMQSKNMPVEVDLGCPYFGCLQDSQTMLTYPSIMNRCHRARPIVSPIFTHQTQYCLSNQYSSCPLLVDETTKSLPTNLRTPIERSELLHYLTSWVMAKIS